MLKLKHTHSKMICLQKMTMIPTCPRGLLMLMLMLMLTVWSLVELLIEWPPTKRRDSRHKRKKRDKGIYKEAHDGRHLKIFETAKGGGGDFQEKLDRATN